MNKTLIAQLISIGVAVVSFIGIVIMIIVSKLAIPYFILLALILSGATTAFILEKTKK